MSILFRILEMTKNIYKNYNTQQTSNVIVIYVLTMVANIVILNILFIRHRFWERLIANTGFILVYVAFYLIPEFRTFLRF